MEKALTSLKKVVQDRLSKTNNINNFNILWLEYFGGNGILTKLVKQLSLVPKNDKPRIGKVINSVKPELETLFKQKKKELLEEKKLNSFDTSLPGIIPSFGHLNSQTQVLNELVSIFNFLGFKVAEGPEIETSWYNFESLNFPK